MNQLRLGRLTDGSYDMSAYCQSRSTGFWDRLCNRSSKIQLEWLKRGLTDGACLRCADLGRGAASLEFSDEAEDVCAEEFQGIEPTVGGLIGAKAFLDWG